MPKTAKILFSNMRRPSLEGEEGHRRELCWEAKDLGNCPKKKNTKKWSGVGATALTTHTTQICVKWVPFVKLAFSLGNRAHLGPKWVHFRPFRTTFSMIVAQIVVFIVISPFPPFEHCKNSDFSFQVLASCKKVNLGQNALFCSFWTQTWSAKKPF